MNRCNYSLVTAYSRKWSKNRQESDTRFNPNYKNPKNTIKGIYWAWNWRIINQEHISSTPTPAVQWIEPVDSLRSGFWLRIGRLKWRIRQADNDTRITDRAIDRKDCIYQWRINRGVWAQSWGWPQVVDMFLKTFQETGTSTERQR